MFLKHVVSLMLICVKLPSDVCGCSPGHDDKEVQSIPRVPEVTAAAKDSQGHHLHNHLQSEKNVDECIESLKEKREGEILGSKNVMMFQTVCELSTTRGDGRLHSSLLTAP